MPQKPRPHRVTVKLDRQEYEALVARAAALDRTKSQVVRDALQETSRKDARPASSGLTRFAAIEILADHPRAGSVTAATALAGELRIERLESARPAVVGPVKLRDRWAVATM